MSKNKKELSDSQLENSKGGMKIIIIQKEKELIEYIKKMIVIKKEKNTHQ